jgi:hypothetical protein
MAAAARFKRGMMAAAVAASTIGAGVIVTSSPAAAAYSSCPSGYHCFFSGSSGGGSRWQFAGTNTNLSGYGIATRSAYNRGTSGMRHCGFESTNFNTLKTSTAQSAQHSYSLRAIRSNTWTWGACSDI